MPPIVYRYTDRPMTWAKAIMLGFVLYALAIILLGQIPSYIIYWFDGNVESIINFTKKIPKVNKEGLNPTQVRLVRDVIANAAQMGFFTVMLVGMYLWQKARIKRTGTKDLQDVAKGYMPGK